MAIDEAANFAKVIVGSAGYTGSSTQIALASVTPLPTINATGGFNTVWWNAASYADPTSDPNVEIVRVNSISTGSNMVNVIRAQEGTVATNKNTAGGSYLMIAGLTAKWLNTDVAPHVDVQVFGSAGGAGQFTWTKPTAGNFQNCKVVLVGGGGGGGGGAGQASGSSRAG